jgi:hypothetical protein
MASIILGGTTALIDAVTTAAVALDVHASWVDSDGTTQTPNADNTAISTAATTTIVPSPTGANVRTVKILSFRNKSTTSSQTVTVRHNDGATTAELISVTLQFGEEMIFMESVGWRLYDASGNVKVGATAVNPWQNDFRLSGVSVTPVMTADSTTLSTIFLCQYKGNTIALYDGTNWQLLSPASEVSLAVTGRTTDLPFDVFAFSSAGVVTLEFLNWTSATARATGLTRLNGVWTKTGDATRRYLGSCRARSATTFHWVRSGTDLPCKLDLFNSDNRVDFGFMLLASTASWAYTLATIRQAQASANYQVDIMVGLQEQTWEATLRVTSQNSTISIARSIGIGFDVTNAFSGLVGSAVNTVASINTEGVARFENQPTIGRHFYAWCEESVATGTCTWIGASATAGAHVQSGMVGFWCC